LQETLFENPEAESMLTYYIKNNEVDFDALNTQFEKYPVSFFLYDISKDELKELQDFIKDENNRQQIREYFKDFRDLFGEVGTTDRSIEMGDQESIKKEQGETKPELTETQQKDLDKQFKDIDEELDRKKKALKEVCYEREVEFNKVWKKEGLFGDAKV